MRTRFDATVQARVPVEVLRKLEAAAQSRCQTLSVLVRQFVVRGLRNLEKLEPKGEVK